MGKPQVCAKSFIGTLLANVDNARLSDAQFREFVRNSLPIVERCNPIPVPDLKGPTNTAQRSFLGRPDPTDGRS